MSKLVLNHKAAQSCTEIVKRIGYCAVLTLLFAFNVIFASCVDPAINNDNEENNTAITVPENLKGTWINPTYGDETYTITNTSYINADLVYGGYSGTIVNVRKTNDEEGYITIKYTQNNNDNNAIGKYYVIYYENLTASTVSMAGAYNGDDPDFDYPKGGGKAAQAEAEAAYTVDAEYFGFHSNVNKIGSGTFTSGMQGKWNNTQNSTPQIIITNKFFRYATGGGTTANHVGEIVKVADNGAAGYLVYKLVGGFTPGANLSLYVNGTYNILKWENYDSTAGTATLYLAGTSSNTWGGVSPSNVTSNSIQEAEALLTAESIPTHLRSRDFTKQP